MVRKVRDFFRSVNDLSPVGVILVCLFLFLVFFGLANNYIFSGIDFENTNVLEVVQRWQGGRVSVDLITIFNFYLIVWMLTLDLRWKKPQGALIKER